MSVSTVTALICHNSKFLLFHRDDIPEIPDPGRWQLPGGHIEDGESPTEAIKRELEEEVSYCPDNLTLIGARTSQNNAKVYLFFAVIKDNEVEKFKLGSKEGQDLGFFDINQSLELKLTPSLRGYIGRYRLSIEKLLKTGKVIDPKEFDLELA